MSCPPYRYHPNPRGEYVNFSETVKDSESGQVTYIGGEWVARGMRPKDIPLSSTRRVFRHNDFGCVAFVQSGPTPPFPNPKIRLRDSWPRQFRKTCFADDTAPYAPYVLTNPDFADGFMSRLNVTRTSIVVEKKGNFFFLEKKKRDSWKRYENALRGLHVLVQHLMDFQHGMNFKFPRAPASYKYDMGFRDENELRTAVLDSRDSFIQNMACLTYIINGHGRGSHDLGFKSEREDKTTPSGWPTWARRAIAGHGYSPTWMEQFLNSDIVNFTAQRAGCYIDAGSGLEWLGQVRWFLNRNVPVVFVWPLNDANYGLDQMRDAFGQNFALTGLGLALLKDTERSAMMLEFEQEKIAAHAAQIAREDREAHAAYVALSAMAGPSGVNWSAAADEQQSSMFWGSTPDTTPVNNTFSHAPARARSPVPPALANIPRCKGQKLGEHWKDFLSRRREQDQLTESKETAVEKQARLQRLAHAQKQLLGRKCSVFSWELMDTLDGKQVWVRSALTKADAQLYFDDYLPEDRSYNSFRDEWELCNDFCPDARGVPLNEQRESNGFYEDDYDDNDRYPVDKISQEEWNTMVIEAVADGGCVDADEFVQSAADHDLVETARKRYGFALPIDDSNYPDHPQLGKVKDFKQVRIILAASVNDNEPNERCKKYLSNFVLYLSSKTETPPSYLWDLSLGSPKYIGVNSSNVVAQRLECKYDDERKTKDENFKSYMLYVPRTPSPWHLLVKDPTVAAECQRLRFDSTLDIAKYLLSRGSNFSTVQSLCDHPKLVEGRYNVTFGERWYDATFSPSDYDVYLGRLRSFLSLPRGRAAYKFGSLIWRIAISCLPPKEDGSILRGPSEDVYALPYELILPDGTSVGDDCLSDLELRFICGTYMVSTSK